MIVLDSLFPVFALILLGILLKKYGLTNSSFLAQSDKLIYFIFFPVLLFWKIGGASLDGGIDWNFCFTTMAVVFGMFLISTTCLHLFKIPAFQAGSFSQSCYRFNTYIGVAVVLNALGEEGITYFGVLIGFVIPMINAMAVSILIWYSGEEMSLAKRVKVLLKALAANPLILGCLAGIIYSRTINSFPGYIDNTLALMSMVTLPLALLSIGGALTFNGVRKHLPVSLLAAFLKLLVLPVMGYGMYMLSGVEGLSLKVGMIFFTLPASTAIYVLSSQLNSDTELASSAIVISTIFSFFSLSVALLL